MLTDGTLQQNGNSGGGRKESSVSSVPEIQQKYNPDDMVCITTHQEYNIINTNYSHLILSVEYGKSFRIRIHMDARNIHTHYMNARYTHTF